MSAQRLAKIAREKLLTLSLRYDYAEDMAHLQESPLVLDWKDCPLVEVNPQKLSGTPILKGTRMPADAIVQNYTSGLPAEEIAEVFQLPADDVRGLLAYAVRHNPALEP